MIRRMLLLLLFATVPALVCAQESKLVNCRSLEAAGNFVGPDEVVVDDLVCQKVKAGTTATAGAAKPQPPKPLPGAVVTEDEPASVVDAAKASAKRVAAAIEANAEKAAGTTGVAAPAPPPPPGAAAQTEQALKPALAPDASDPGGETMSVAGAARANAKRMAEAEAVPQKPASAAVVSSSPPPTAVAKMPFKADAAAKPQPAIIRKAELTEPTISPAKAPAESAPVEATPAPAAPPPERREPAPVEVTRTPTGSVPPAAESTPAPAAEIVITSAPSREEAVPASSSEGKEPAAASPTSPETAAAPLNEIAIPSAPSRASETAAPAPRPDADAVASKPPTAAEVDKQPAASAPAGSDAPVSAFYDANAPKNSSNRPTVTLGVVTAPPAGAVVSPDGEPPANATNSPAEAAPAAEPAPGAEPDAQPIWPGNVEPNMERERVVETGTFALPKEVPDPNQPPHSKQIAPSPEDGFQEGQRADCRKNVTIGGLKGEKLVLGTPKWAADWIEKNQKRMLDVCFSDTPMQGARNYLIVFYTSATTSGGPLATTSGGPEAANPAVPPPQGGSPAAGVGTFTTSYGSTWHYFFDRNVGVTVNSSLDADQPQSQPNKVSYATAYTEEGVPVAQHWQAAVKKQIRLNPDDPNVRRESKKERHAREEMEHVADALLSQMVEEIEKL